MTTKLNIAVSTFVNPYLFWIQDKDVQYKLVYLQKTLMKSCKPSIGGEFTKGDIVGVFYDKAYYRGIIEQCPEKTKDDDLKYLCWLMDYAVLIESKQICKLESNLKKIPPFIEQACLNNIVFVEEKMDYNLISEGIITKELTTSPCPQVREKILEIIKDYDNFEFVVHEKNGGILIGDIILNNKKESISLSKLLNEKGIMQTNNPLFEDIKDKIALFKDNQISFLRQISKNVKLNTSGMSLMDVSLSEYEERDVYNSSESYISIRKRDSYTKSSDVENNTPLNTNDSVGNRRKLMLQKILNRKKKASLENSFLEENSSLEENSIEVLDVNSSTKSIEEGKTSTDFSDFSELNSRPPRNVNFLPAGSNLNVPQKNKPAPPHKPLKNGWLKHSTPLKPHPITSLSETRKFNGSTTSLEAASSDFKDVASASQSRSSMASLESSTAVVKSEADNNNVANSIAQLEGIHDQLQNAEMMNEPIRLRRHEVSLINFELVSKVIVSGAELYQTPEGTWCVRGPRELCLKTLRNLFGEIRQRGGGRGPQTPTAILGAPPAILALPHQWLPFMPFFLRTNRHF